LREAVVGASVVPSRSAFASSHFCFE
jgi:hypothetical protein